MISNNVVCATNKGSDLLRVTSWFDTVINAATRWMNFGENHLHEHDLQLFDYNI